MYSMMDCLNDFSIQKKWSLIVKGRLFTCWRSQSSLGQVEYGALITPYFTNRSRIVVFGRGTIDADRDSSRF